MWELCTWSFSSVYRNKADFLDSELNSFCAQYLQDS